jgi:hypothetical protein
MIPPSGYTIRHNRDGDFGLWPAGDGKSEFRDCFTIHEGPDSNLCVFKVFLWVNSEGVFVYQALSKRYGDARLQEFFLTWAVERIARGLREGEFVNGQDRIEIGEEELRLVEQIAAEKRCDYQVTEGRDWYCTGDTSRDTALGPMRTVGLKKFSPTSLHQCRNCTLPDSRILCSQLSHPSLMSGVGAKSRMIADAKCGINQPNIQNGGGCHAGGHPCWQYWVMPTAQDQPSAYVSPALTRVLDYLDTAWRLRFRKADRLVTSPSVENAGSLERACVTREEFGNRIIALADMLAALQPDSVLDAATLDKVKGSLSRLEVAINQNIVDLARRSRAIDGVNLLRAANDLRAGVAHGGYKARAAAVNAERGLGVTFYPNESWGRTWDHVRARVTEALSWIAAVLREP